MCGGTSKIVCRPLPADDPKVRRPDIALARRVLGWQPRIEIEEGLARTHEYFVNELARQTDP